MKREAALKKLWLQILCAVLVLGLMTSFYAPAVFAQNPSPEELKHKVELYLRNMFAFGPEISACATSPSSGRTSSAT